MKREGSTAARDRDRDRDRDLRHASSPGSRRLRRTLLWLMALLVVLLIVDRAALVITEHRLASRIQTAENLQSRPRLSIHGVPFLTQVVRGRYSSVGLQSSDPIRAAG